MAIKKYKNAFSLVEVLVSMIILMIVTTSMVAVLTSAKPRIEETTIQGQFICYTGNNGRVFQWQANGRTPLTNEPVAVSGSSCTLELTKKPAFYYIISVGPGDKKSDGQVKTYYLNQIKGNLKFTPGLYSSHTDTTIVEEGSSASIESAKAGIDADNGLNIDNLSDCYLMSAQSSCPNGNIGRQQHCKIGSVSYDGGQDIPSVIIQGCENNEGVSGIEIARFEKSNSGSDMSFYNYGVGVNNVRANFVFVDGSFVSNKGTKKANWGNSKIGQIIDTMPSRRQSELIDRFKTARPGVRKQNGAVLVIW